MQRMRLVLAALVLMVSTAAFAVEDDPSAKVRALFDSGMTHYNLAEYKEALADFKEAYRLKHDPVFLFNLGQTWRQLGDADQALRAYRAYLREAPTAPNRAEVEKLIADEEHALEQRQMLSPPSAVIPPQAEPNPAPRPVEPAAPKRIVVVAPVATATPPPEPAPKKSGTSTWWWVAGGAALVVVGGGIAAAAIAASSSGGAPHTDAGTFAASFQ